MRLNSIAFTALVAAALASAPAAAAEPSGHAHAGAELASMQLEQDPFAAVYIVTSRKTYDGIRETVRDGVAKRDSLGNALMVSQIKAHQLSVVSEHIHQNEKRCGGYFAFKTRTAAFTAVGVTCAPPDPPIGGGPLTNGVAKTGQSGPGGSELRYTLVVPAGATGLTFVTSGGTGDADLYVKFGSAPTTTVNDCKSESSTNNETCNIATAQVGTYHVLVYAFSDFSGMSITGSYTLGDVVQTYTNLIDYVVYDSYIGQSPIVVSGRTGNAPAAASVTVEVALADIGKLKLDLVAPDGTLYNIHNRTNGGTRDLTKTMTLDLSSEALNGTWTLRGETDYNGPSIGYINSWNVTF